MSVIELAKPGQEATTYELVITVANAASTLSTVFATQLTTPLKVVACTEQPCPSDQVDVSGSQEAFNDSNGPDRYTSYLLVLLSISVVCTIIFTPFLPKDKAECHEWRKQGIEKGNSFTYGIISLIIACCTVGVR
jgi:hypothetical protein